MPDFQSAPAGAVDSTPIAVQLDSLEEVQYWMNYRASLITEKLSALAAQLDPLQATWSGQTATYYQGLQQEWDTAAAGLFGPDGVLGDIARAMHIVWNNYSTAEWDNSRTWQS
jgi:WXG100 family type VII secretion target